jgi:hypothetical protein
MARRVLLWVVSLGCGQFIGHVLGAVRAPDAPEELHLIVGALAGVLLAVILDVIVRVQARAFELARRGDRAAIAHALAERARRGWMWRLDPVGTAALEIAAGQIDAGRARLTGQTGRLALAALAPRCVLAHAQLASPRPEDSRAALDSLLQTHRLGPAWLRRYRAYLVARAALQAGDPALGVRAAELLARERDPEVRAYLQWLRARWDAQPFDALDREEHAARGADLLTELGDEATAARVRTRAVALRAARAAGAPFR